MEARKLANFAINSLVALFVFHLGAAGEAQAASGSCRVSAISDGPGLQTYLSTFSASGNTPNQCRDALESQVVSWCWSLPVEGGRHCRSDWGTLAYFGFEAESQLPREKTFACKAYEHGWINGNVIEMQGGARVDLRGQGMNDEISSTWTAPNCKLSVYEHSDFQGYLMDLGPGENRTLGINDRISSMECKCK